ncbi:MAG: hypothetical protein AB1696_16435 [Planctomycetota bacterium]
MNREPIVEEIRRVRKKMLDECGGDMDKLMDRIAQEEAKQPNRITSPAQLKELMRRKAGS